MQRDETQRENQNSGTSGKKDSKTSSSYSHPQSSNPRPNSNTTPKPHFSTNGNSASSGSKDKTKPNPLANKLGKNGKLTRNEWECHIKEGLCLYCGKSGHVVQDCPKALAAKACAASVESKDSADSKKIVRNPQNATWPEGCIDLDRVAKYIHLF